jgi:hypothetical protein
MSNLFRKVLVIKIILYINIMNPFILGIIKIYVVATLVYIAYMIYLKIYKKPTFASELNDYPELLDKYNHNKKTRTTVFIIGVIIGLILLLIIDNPTNKDNKSTKQLSKLINDVSDMYVL